MKITQPSIVDPNFLNALKDLIGLGINRRSAVASYVKQLDMQIDGPINLTEEQEEMKKENENGDPPQPVPERLEMVNAQIEEAISYCMAVLGEQNKLYQAVDKVEKQAAAEQMAAVMNLSAVNFDHFTNIQLALYCGFRYNLFIMTTVWTEIEGKVIRPAEDDLFAVPTTETAVIKKGNELLAVNPANFVYDPRVAITSLRTDGQYFGVITKGSEFSLAQDGISIPKDGFAKQAALFEMEYNSTALDDKMSELSGEPTTLDLFMPLPAHVSERTDQLTIFTLYFKWKTETGKDYDLWKLICVNGVPIKLEKLTNPHGMLPVAVAILSKGKSYAEKLLPFQNAATTKFNLHIDSLHKAIYGVLFYNEKLFPSLRNYSPLAARIPFDPGASQTVDLNGKDLRYINETPQTNDTFNHIELMDTLMQKILPTATRQNLGNLDRATRFQAANVVASSNQTMLMILRSVHSQAMAHLVNMQMYNVLQFQENEEVFKVDNTARPEETHIQVTRKDLLSFGGNLNIGTGLKGIDRLSEAELLRDILGMIIQSQEAIQETDFLKLLDHYTSIAGDQTDFTQFRKQYQHQQQAVDSSTGQPLNSQAPPASQPTQPQPAQGV